MRLRMTELKVLFLPCLSFGIAPFFAIVNPSLVFPIVLSILVAIVVGSLLAASGEKGDD